MEWRDDVWLWKEWSGERCVCRRSGVERDVFVEGVEWRDGCLWKVEVRKVEGGEISHQTWKKFAKYVKQSVSFVFVTDGRFVYPIE